MRELRGSPVIPYSCPDENANLNMLKIRKSHILTPKLSVLHKAPCKERSRTAQGPIIQPVKGHNWSPVSHPLKLVSSV